MKKFTILLFSFVLSLSLFAQGGGTCAHFDGTNDYLHIGDYYEYSNEFTIELWAFADDWTVPDASPQTLMGKFESSTGWQIRLKNDKVVFNVGSGSIYYSCTIDATQLASGWHHIAASFDNTNGMNLWVDGSLNDQNGNTVYGSNGSSLLIGADVGSGSTPDGSYYGGYIDEVRIWDKELTQAQIQENMHTELVPASYTDLRGYYRLNTPDELEDDGNATDRDLTNYGCTFSDESTPIGSFPTGYTTDMEAVWLALGTDWSDESTGMSLRDYNIQTFGTSEFYAFANNNLTGTSASDIPSTVAIRASTIWYIDDVASDRVDLNFDLSEFGAAAIEETGLDASEYVLLNRTGTSGDFSIVDNGTSITAGDIYFEDYLPTDGYYTIGRKFQLPVVSTTTISNIGNETATGGGNVSDDGGGTVSARGVCWSTATSPTTDDDFTTDGTGTGTFVSSLSGLCQGTTYYVRAYATNEAGTAYGDEESFSTTGTPLTVTTQAVSGISYVTATGNGNITNLGSANPTAHGVCWNTGGNPTLADDYSDEGSTSSTGAFTTDITGLDPGTTYYVKSYATNSCGTSYGDQVSFQTTAGQSNVVYSNLDNGGTSTLRSVITAASDGDEITFNLASGSETIVIASQIAIAKNITIDGDNTAGSGTDVTVQVTTPGTSTYRVFHLNGSGKTYNIKNIALRGGDPEDNGGVVYLEYGSFDLDNVTVSDGNLNDRSGGGICIGSSAGTGNIIRNSRITNNEALSGGGLTVSGSDVQIINSLIDANAAANNGGGFLFTNAEFEIINSTISHNESTDKGGGIYIDTYNSGTIQNTTIAENHCDASDNGGGLYLLFGSLSVKNTILANNYRGSGTTTGDDYYYNNGTLTDNGYNIIEYQDGSFTGSGKTFTASSNLIYSGSGNDWNHNGGTTTGQLYLSSTLADNGGPTQTLSITNQSSIAVYNGYYDATVTTTDQRGVDRYDPPTIGAYEFSDFTTWYVDVDATGNADGTSWTDAFTTIQAGVNAASTHEKVLVADGTYETATTTTPGWNLKNRVLINKAITVESVNGAGSTIIKGAADPVNSGFGDNAVRAVYLGGGGTLTGFTIRDGWTMQSPNQTYYEISGGGALIYNGTIENCIVTSNSCRHFGAGILMYYNSGDANSAIGTVKNCRIYDNWSDNSGAAIYIVNDGNVINTLIYNNEADVVGGGIYLFEGGTITNVTITRNSTQYGGGVYASNGGTVENCIVWNNTASTGLDDIQTGNTGWSILNTCSSTSVTHGVDGCIVADPCFVNSGNGDFTLSHCSPCTDAGNNTYCDEAYDYRGSNYGRKLNKETGASGTIDMGCYEYKTGSDPLFSETEWNGTSSTGWNTAANWNGLNVPCDCYNVTIDDEANDPAIGPTETADCNNLTVETGGSLTIQSGSSGTGSLIVHGTASGDVTAERYVTAGKWHYVSSPVDAVNLATWMPLNNIATETGGQYQFYRWDEDTQYWIYYGYTGTEPENFGDTEFVDARGYCLTTTSDGDLSFTGTPITTDVSYSVSNDGNSCHLLGNPFTSTIAITNDGQANDNFLADNTTILDENYQAIYVWNEGESYTYGRNDYSVVCNTGFSGQGSGSIIDQDFVEPGQAFMVKVKQAGTIYFNQDIRKHGDADYYKSKESWPGVELSASAENTSNATAIAFNSEMTHGLDPTYDAGKMKANNELSVYTLLVEDNGHQFAVQALPDQNIEDIIVSVGTDIAEPIQVEFSIYQENLDNYNIVLEDRQTGTFTNLRRETYATEITQSGTGRFYLHFKDATAIGEITPETKISLRYLDGRIQINNPELENGYISLVNVGGQVLDRVELDGNYFQEFTIQQVSGIYIISIQTEKAQVSRKTFVK